ncbi:MAG: hypothetical protein L6R42_005756 [Xanthoria sp. 1 TBL-2021]|nr:MAG: hypothetical protein L6R42_005756 [Xanthoria sp. 1 TBL-2021]
MALDAATAREMIQKLAEDRATYLDTLSRAHDVLAKALTASATGKSPPQLTSDAVRRNTLTSVLEIESLKKSSTFSPDDSDTDDNESLFAQEPLLKELYDEDGLRRHLRGFNWTPSDREIVGSVLDNKQLLQRSSIFPVTLGPVDDRSHLSHYSIFDVGKDGAPLQIQRADEKPVSRAQAIWNNIKSINADVSRTREAVGRITIVREPSPLLFAALHYTMTPHFDMDEIFRMLAEDKTRAEAHRPFSPDHRHQRTFVFTLDFYTIIGDECQPMTWQKSDEDHGSSTTHIPISRCSSVVALSLTGQPARQVKNKARRAVQKIGQIFDPFAPWHVLSLQSYPDWKHSIDAHNSTRHYVNGPEAFLITLRAEFKDAQKRLLEVYNRISDLVRMPSNFMFNEAARDKLLFEDENFTFSRRYFWAHQSLGIMNEDIQEMSLSYRKVFTDSVWDGSSKLVWPGDESVSSRYANWRKRMRKLREDIESELQGLENIAAMNSDKMKEIKGLRDNLFSGTSVLESRRSVDQAMITVQQGHNIKLLTLVTIFFLPLTFVTSVFGMTNMNPDEGFLHFGIVTTVICVPTYFLIGSLNTTSGAHFWRKKTQQFFAAIGEAFVKVLAFFGYRPQWANRPSSFHSDLSNTRPLQRRSQSAREGMAARDYISPPPTSPTNTAPFNRRPTLSPNANKEGSSQNDLHNSATPTTTQFEGEQDNGPTHLIRKLDQGDHRKTSSWGSSNGHGIAATDRSTRHPTFLDRIPEVDNARKDEAAEGEGWISRVLTWGSGSTKKKKGFGKAEREV